MNSMSVIKIENVLTPITKTIGTFYVRLVFQSFHNKTKIPDTWQLGKFAKLHSGTQLRIYK